MNLAFARDAAVNQDMDRDCSAPLPAFLGLLERRQEHLGRQQLRDPGLGELSGCRVPGQQHTTRFRCRALDLRQRRAQLTVSRAQVQQEPLVETSEGTGINITCSHPNIQSHEYIQWYRQLSGQGPAFLVSAVTGSKKVPDPEGQLWVSADRRSSALCLARPRLGDAALYYCAVDTRKRSRGCGRARTAWGGAGAQCRPGPQGALPAWPPNSILTGVRRPELYTETSSAPIAATD
ncbi:uncharacterized protein LOC125684396 [Lagopus muta]|uniref:uncharacterized protein LOC125684396 n=1 Tax=Lagopus muta TaxID=64668 RepID=UPI0020A0B5A2|nr:uncharacterized protein LOC125684396 [Lagopus muta]